MNAQTIQTGKVLVAIIVQNFKDKGGNLIVLSHAAHLGGRSGTRGGSRVSAILIQGGFARRSFELFVVVVVLKENGKGLHTGGIQTSIVDQFDNFHGSRRIKGQTLTILVHTRRISQDANVLGCGGSDHRIFFFFIIINRLQIRIQQQSTTHVINGHGTDQNAIRQSQGHDAAILAVSVTRIVTERPTRSRQHKWMQDGFGWIDRLLLPTSGPGMNETSQQGLG
mmetsp:Transcript_1004/g.2292  ORF Transcript_1004/g.2292 Transcript_1004/m.2292 type:complete len:224 (+) Transcript_1004:92-763(+)